MKNMYSYLYISIYVCACIYIYIYIYMYIYVCVSVYIYIYMCVCVCVCVCGLYDTIIELNSRLTLIEYSPRTCAAGHIGTFSCLNSYTIN